MEKAIKGLFEGYLWKSDQQNPEIYEGQNKLNGLILDENENPFIVEGQLYDSSGNGHSVCIKYVDGKYIVNEYDIKNDFVGVVDNHSYRGNKMKGRNLLFKELWEPEKDPLCKYMEVLRATKVAFVGFE